MRGGIIRCLRLLEIQFPMRYGRIVLAVHLTLALWLWGFLLTAGLLASAVGIPHIKRLVRAALSFLLASLTYRYCLTGHKTHPLRELLVAPALGLSVRYE